ncbi:MAG TPA: class I SAM-dependent methyltransferase [Candidatus Acidoferrales bacterium]|nr:class I SAM-dependent methyltransferase [Candidatus Acidoferrales bacterium]
MTESSITDTAPAPGGAPFSSRTYDPRDLALPPMAPWARALRAFGARLALGGTPFAVNGVLRRRFFVRRHKLWEYAASAAYLLQAREERPLRILDFGGAATLPIYFFAARKCQVECLDIDAALCAATRRAAARHRWLLKAGSHNLVESPAPGEWMGAFDAVISASVLEHLPKERQAGTIERLAGLLRPGGKLVLSFDFGAQAPQPGAVRSVEEVESLVAASGLDYAAGKAFHDTGARFALDRRHPDHRFTFGVLFLERKK